MLIMSVQVVSWAPREWLVWFLLLPTLTCNFHSSCKAGILIVIYAWLVFKVRVGLGVSFRVSVGVKVIKQASLPCIAGTTSNCKSTGGGTSNIFFPGIADIVSYKFYGN